jgi:hypothetical protein
MSFSEAVHTHLHTQLQLAYPMSLFVGKPTASRAEIFDTINIYATQNQLYRPDPYTIRPDVLLAALLCHPRPIPVADLNRLIAQHIQ